MAQHRSTKKKRQKGFCKAHGKVRFRSQCEAREARMTISTQGEERQVSPCREYLCPDCNGWHLTSKEGNHYEGESKNVKNERCKA